MECFDRHKEALILDGIAGFVNGEVGVVIDGDQGTGSFGIIEQEGVVDVVAKPEMGFVDFLLDFSNIGIEVSLLDDEGFLSAKAEAEKEVLQPQEKCWVLLHNSDDD